MEGFMPRFSGVDLLPNLAHMYFENTVSWRTQWPRLNSNSGGQHSFKVCLYSPYFLSNENFSPTQRLCGTQGACVPQGAWLLLDALNACAKLPTNHHPSATHSMYHTISCKKHQCTTPQPKSALHSHSSLPSDAAHGIIPQWGLPAGRTHQFGLWQEHPYLGTLPVAHWRPQAQTGTPESLQRRARAGSCSRL